MFAVPLAGLVQGPQSGTTTGPDTPAAPVCTWAAAAGPVRPLNVSCQVSTAPEPEAARVTVAGNAPRAALTSPFGAGTSWAAVIGACRWIVVAVAWLRAPAAPATASARTSGAADALHTTVFFTRVLLLTRSGPACPIPCLRCSTSRPGARIGLREEALQPLERAEQESRRNPPGHAADEPGNGSREDARVLGVVHRAHEPLPDGLLRVVVRQAVPPREFRERLVVPGGEQELLPRHAELARRTVEGGERDLLERRLHAARLAPLAHPAGVGHRGRLVGRAAEREVGAEHDRDGGDRDEERRQPSHSPSSLRPSASGISAASASAAATRNGAENACVTARSSSSSSRVRSEP